MHLLSAAAASLLLLDFAVASPQPRSSPKVVGFKFKKEVRHDINLRRLRPRQQVVEADLINGNIMYLVNVTVGTPPQPLTLLIDTGSSDIWFPAVGTSACLNTGDNCETFGGFNESASSTLNVQYRNMFQISYVDGTEVRGDYVTDTFQIGGADVKDLIMAIATKTSGSTGLSSGIMGIGYREGESLVSYGYDSYPNIINMLKQQGYIKTLSYSLWLNDLESAEGNILFGGVDRDKYEGELVVVPVVPDSYTNSFTSFTVALTGLTLTNGAGDVQYSKEGIEHPVILDSGTSLTYLPDGLALDIINGVGATLSRTIGTYVVPCTMSNIPGKFAFRFGDNGGPVIQVDFNQFVTPIETLDGSQARFADGTLACRWGILPAGNNPYLFGDTFLRAAYVVHDLENNVLAIAQTTFNSTSSSIEEISSDGIPGAQSTASGVQVTQTATAVQQPSGGLAGQATGVTAGVASGTFNLPTSSSSKGAAASLGRPPSAMDLSVLVTGGIVLASMLFGGGLIAII